MKLNNMPDTVNGKRTPGKQVFYNAISVIVSSGITLFGLYESLKTTQACFVFAVCAVMLIVISFIIKRRSSEKFGTFLLNGIAILILSSSVFLYDWLTEVNGSIWYESIKKNNDESLIEMKSKADNGDGVAQMELSDYYDARRDFEHASKYAQKAAFNGNARAYERLALYNLEGLGCKVDVQSAISYTIDGMKHGEDAFTRIWKIIEEKKIVLSPTDSLKLKRCVDKKQQLESIFLEADSVLRLEGLVSLVQYIDNNKAIIEDASIDGYRPATELLYVNEFIKHPQGSDELHRLATMLYQASFLPTQTLDRSNFYRYYHNEESYDTKNFKRYIKENDYALLIFGDRILDIVSPEKLLFYTDAAVLNEYELYRAQFEWLKKLNDGTIKPVYFIWKFYFASTFDEASVARELLKRSIAEVQDRMDHPAEKDPAVYDLLMSRGVEIHIATPWSPVN